MVSHPVGAAVSVLAWSPLHAGSPFLLEDQILQTRKKNPIFSKKQFFIEIVNKERMTCK